MSQVALCPLLLLLLLTMAQTVDHFTRHMTAMSVTSDTSRMIADRTMYFVPVFFLILS